MKTRRPSETGRNRQICTFKIEDRLFGVDILDVKEINTETEITPIFHAPSEVKGYVNIRGQIHLILDLRLMIGLDPKPVGEASRLVLFKNRVGENFGVLVDSIGDVEEVDGGLIEDRRREDRADTPDKGDRRKAEFGAGVCKLDDSLIVILNSNSLISYFKDMKQD